MRYTIFNTPVLSSFFKLVSFIALKISGWTVHGKPPEADKYVLIAAPHTSNWDLPYTLFCAFMLNVEVHWMGKEEIFNNPFRKFFIWLGGIPVDRSKSTNMVQRSIDMLNEHEKFALVVPPSGTRSKVTAWKTGFYHIANGANVPIGLGFLDWENKRGGFLGAVTPTGDIENDMKTIGGYYKGIKGKYPLQDVEDIAVVKKKEKKAA